MYLLCDLYINTFYYCSIYKYNTYVLINRKNGPNINYSLDSLIENTIFDLIYYKTNLSFKENIYIKEYIKHSKSSDFNLWDSWGDIAKDNKYIKLNVNFNLEAVEAI